MTCILKYLSIFTFPCLFWGARKPVFEGGPAFSCPRPHMFGKINSPSFPRISQFCFINDSTGLQLRPFISTALTIIKSSSSLYLCLVCFRFVGAFCFDALFKLSGRRTWRTFYFPRQRRFQKKYYLWTPLAQTSMHSQIVLEIGKMYIVLRSRLNFFFTPFCEKL